MAVGLQHLANAAKCAIGGGPRQSRYLSREAVRDELPTVRERHIVTGIPLAFVGGFGSEGVSELISGTDTLRGSYRWRIYKHCTGSSSK